MDFGIFMEFEIRRGGDQATAFREGFDVVDAAEAWGLDGVWLGEMHFTPARSVLSAPIVVASSIATRTKRLRIGMAVQVLPLNNPLRIAEEAATSRSDQRRALRLRDRPQRLPARLRRVRHPLRGESGALSRGARDHPRGVEGRAVQLRRASTGASRTRPSRRARISCPTRRFAWPPRPRRRSRESERWGCPSSSACAAWTSATLRNHVLAYRRAWREAGHAGDGNVYLRIPVYAADHGEGALEEPFESASFYFSRQADLQQTAVGRTGAGPAERLQARVERLAGLSYEQILGRARRVRQRRGPDRPLHAAAARS